jgi:hypothetical protein
LENLLQQSSKFGSLIAKGLRNFRHNAFSVDLNQQVIIKSKHGLKARLYVAVVIFGYRRFYDDFGGSMPGGCPVYLENARRSNPFKQHFRFHAHAWRATKSNSPALGALELVVHWRGSVPVFFHPSQTRGGKLKHKIDDCLILLT